MGIAGSLVGVVGIDLEFAVAAAVAAAVEYPAPCTRRAAELEGVEDTSD